MIYNHLLLSGIDTEALYPEYQAGKSGAKERGRAVIREIK